MPRIEVVIDELFREILEQSGIARRVAGADIVERFDNAHAREVAPEAIGIAGSKEPVVRSADPGGQLLASRGFFLRFTLGGVWKGRRRHLAGAIVFYFSFGRIGDCFVERPGAFDRSSTDLFSFALRVFLQ